MAGDRAAAIICDTGALLDYLVASAADHRLFRAAIDRARTRYGPALVLAEVDDFLRAERPAMRRFVSDLRRGLGLVDSSVVALAEDLGLSRLATRDIRHFAVVRLRDGRPFELVVNPTQPDRS